jgi:hypothetical protein
MKPCLQSGLSAKGPTAGGAPYYLVLHIFKKKLIHRTLLPDETLN